MLSNLTGWHFLVILVVVLLLFGAPKLPGLARSLGQSLKIFKSEIKSDEPAADQPAADQPAPVKPAADQPAADQPAGTVDPRTKP
ncbi:twin-arginine translocase TatA/TatE family subunit [Cryobacterium melibiosiphilum]|uniref:Sec-independent protein translocase protein TatA n=1 Tax=Cryobacterium melibiosiphilum TaxID=995039 RepID=A0A3A5MVN6_9MICO|nr:Sec-independent protein translocase subunit TatA [Cryobacterium melibiosiphilum]RJT89254.1 twin-arginine translocase TatA/TatE family subunit [Cryobacterium melibiosiphilum]